jgi:small GTP-binding protein
MIQRKRLKCCFIGDYGVGKTCCLHALLDRPLTNVRSTVGIDFFSKTICVANTDVHLSLWDTAGAERYRSLMHAYLRDADMVVLVYDLSKRDSNIVQWMRVIEQHHAKVVGVLGNKNDLTTEFDTDLDEILFPWSRQPKTILTGTCTSRNPDEVKHFLKKCLLALLRRKTSTEDHLNIQLNASVPKSNKCCT